MKLSAQTTPQEEEYEEEFLIHSVLPEDTKEPTTSGFKEIIFAPENVQTLNDTILSWYRQTGANEKGLDYNAFRYGIIGYLSLKQEGKLSRKNLVSIIDYTKSSCEKRFFTIDLEKKELLFHTYVSHGQRSGRDMANKFSNIPESHQSSLGFFVTGEDYYGSKGYSLRLHGDEVGINDKAYDRAIVMHKADYVSEEWIKRYGRIGRSWGCPAFPVQISKKIIKTIKGKTAVFAYFNDDTYLKVSKHLNVDQLLERLNNQGK